jgi:hypothetical protein
MLGLTERSPVFFRLGGVKKPAYCLSPGFTRYVQLGISQLIDHG